MIWDDVRDEVQSRLADEIYECKLLRQTSGSMLYLLKGNREYVLKETMNYGSKGEYENHKKVFGIWSKCSGLEFGVPEPFFISNDESFYVMEYVKDSVGLRDIIPQSWQDSVDVYRKAGLCLRQYHRMMTDAITGSRDGIERHVMIAKLLKSKKGGRLRQMLAEFRPDSYRVIFKDFTFSNVVVDRQRNLYLIDFQKIDFFAPLYYDLARFIDTFKVFTFIKYPFASMLNARLIGRAAESFVQGYGPEVDRQFLKKMQRVHRLEHVATKYQQKPMQGLILKCLYTCMR